MLVQGKYIIVSGIGPGLGSKLAIHAAIEGAAGIAIGSRSPEKLAEAEQRIRDASDGCRIVSLQTDIREAAQCQALASKAFEAFGRIDALINSAVYHGPLGDSAAASDFAHWPEQYATNVLGTMKMSQAVLPAMKQQGGGSIVMISTVGAKTLPIVDEAGYCASKAALLNLARKLAQDVGPDQIRVNTLHPSFMWGVPVQRAMPYFAQQWGGEQKALEFIKSHIALRRIPTDDEVARAALFLASDYSSAITGASLDANGGSYMP
jgi:NAD(P)-dependent dehydrogenase (short-subunit alcohol dehydrogenase family)